MVFPHFLIPHHHTVAGGTGGRSTEEVGTIIPSRAARAARTTIVRMSSARSYRRGRQRRLFTDEFANRRECSLLARENVYRETERIDRSRGNLRGGL